MNPNMLGFLMQLMAQRGQRQPIRQQGAPYPGWNQMASGWSMNGQGGFMPPGTQAPPGTWAPPALGYQPQNPQGISKGYPHPNMVGFLTAMMRPGMSRMGGNFDRSMMGRRPAY